MKIEKDMIIDESGNKMPIRFKSEEEIADLDRKYALYAWINEQPDEWCVKIGSAKANGVASRLRHEQGVDVFKRVVGLWEAGKVDGNDGPVHNKLKKIFSPTKSNL